MGLMLVAAGALVLALSLAVYTIPAVRRLEGGSPRPRGGVRATWVALTHSSVRDASALGEG